MIACVQAWSSRLISSDNLHTQLVGWIKIILPLAALALLSTLFLFARAPGDAPAIPFAEIAELARDQRITSPQFSGMTEDGSMILIAAKNARPDADQPRTMRVEALSLRLDAADGSSLDITSGISLIDGAAQTARLEGLARLKTSTGYVMETTGLLADLNTGVITSEGALEIQAPYGQITAGRIRIALSQDGTGQQMLFTDGVRLLYNPQTSGE